MIRLCRISQAGLAAAGAVLLLAGICTSAESAAQPLRATSLNPAGGAIDAAVGDQGFNSTSLRRVEPGIAQHSFAARLTLANFGQRWTPFDPASPLHVDPSTGLTHSQNFQFRSPGLRALVDRPQYARVGGNTRALIGANTVFQLTPEAPATPPRPLPPPHENFRDLRLNLRLADLPTPTVDPATGEARLDTRGFRFPAAAEAAWAPDLALPQPRLAQPTTQPATPSSTP